MRFFHVAHNIIVPTTHSHIFISIHTSPSLSPEIPGSAIRNSRNPPPLLRQRRVKLLERHQQIRTTRAPNIHLWRPLLLPKRHRQRTDPHGRIRRAARARVPQERPDPRRRVRHRRSRPPAHLRRQALMVLGHVAL